MLKKLLLFTLFTSLQTSATALNERCDISGVWQHAGKPAKLFIDTDKGEISVHSHELNPNAVGLVVIKNVAAETNDLTWAANMYHAENKDFVAVHIVADRCDVLTVRHQSEVILKLIKD